MIWLYCSLCLIFGFAGGLMFALWSVASEIDAADIGSDEKRRIHDLLGIPEDAQ
jgi:hypothetical protein